MLDATDSDALAAALASTGAGAGVADSVTTYVGLRWLGTSEATPVVAAAIDRLGLLPGLILRTLGAVALVAICWKLVTVQHLRLAVLTVVALVHVWVVGANLHVMSAAVGVG